VKAATAPRRVVESLGSLALIAFITPHGRALQAPAFEVASVKPVKADGNQLRPFDCGFGPGGARFRAFGTLRMLIACAYQVPASVTQDKVLGGPKWLDSELFALEAKSPDAHAPRSLSAGLAMLQTLLAERFKLVVHRERRLAQSYALVVERGDGTLGPSLHPTPAACAAWIAGGRQGAPPPEPAGDLPCGRQQVGPFAFRATAMTMSQLANLLSRRVDGFVEDRTGLTGTFVLDLQWRSDATAGASGGADAVASDPGVPASVFAALPVQLGLKLNGSKTAIEVFVVDRAERPTPN